MRLRKVLTQMSEKPTILILGAGIYQVPLIRAAKRRGLRTVVASISGSYPGFELADRACFINTTDIEEILKLAEEEQVDGITTTGTDVAVHAIGHVCSRLGLPGISEEASRLLTDKALMKEAFAKCGVTTAPFQIVASCEETVEAAEKIGYPAILKIVDKSGSRGITKLNSRKEVRAAWDYAREATDAAYMLVEQFISGTEIGIDAFVQNGRLKMLLPHAKYMYQSGRTGIPAGHYCPMNYSAELYCNMKKETEKIIQATGMDNCAVNIDAFALPDNRVSIIEAAGRCGATGIPEVISGYTGRNYYDCILDNALGIPVRDFELRSGCPTASVLLFAGKSGVLRSVRYRIGECEFENENATVEGICTTELDVKPGDAVRAFQNGTDRIGMAVFSADTVEMLWKRVEEFQKSLKIEVIGNGE